MLRQCVKHRDYSCIPRKGLNMNGFQQKLLRTEMATRNYSRKEGNVGCAATQHDQETMASAGITGGD